MSPRYWPFYCEENVWWLCQERGLGGGEVAVLSNPRHAFAMWEQRASTPRKPIVWDYHVVLAVAGSAGVEVWDLDSALGAPVPASRWLEGSFGRLARAPSSLWPMARIVGAEEYAATFSSDRSHMIEDGRYREPPPPWPPILRGAPNLEALMDMSADRGPGVLVDLDGLRGRWLAPR